MKKYPLVVYHRSPLMGTTLRGQAEYAYHTLTSPEDFGRVEQSRRDLVLHLGYEALVTLHQTHSARVHQVTHENLDFFLSHPLEEGDGLWTTLDGVLLGVFTADCLPLFFWGEGVIGVVHAGRKGVYQEIHREMIAQLVQAGYKPADVHVLIGPHIRRCCYEVGEEIIAAVSTTYAYQKDDRWYLDLEAKVRDDLQRDGVRMIESIPICTYCGDHRLWYSYRRGDRQCRHLHVIGKKKTQKN